MAEGGNRVEGVWKENRARMPLLGASDVDSVTAWPLGCEFRREKNVRIVGRPMTQSSIRITW